MAVRVNTLGKSAILNRQLNSSYDVVEYVADNMPLLLDLVKKFDTLKIVRDIYDIINHVANQEIHLTEEQVNSLNQIETISAALEQAGINVSGLTNQLTTLSNSLQQHINNNVIHVTDEDKTLWNSYANTLQALTDLINQVNNKDIDYNDLKNKPVLQHITVDSALDSTSRNPLENRAIANELANYPTRSNISRVGFTGQYRDLVGIPSGDTMLDSTSTNWVTNQCVTEAIEELSAAIANAGLTEAQVRAIIQIELAAYKLDIFTIVSALPQSGTEGIAYLVPVQGENLKYTIYTWEVIDNTTNPYTYGFVQLGGGTVTVDLSNYYTKSETDSLLNNKAASSHTHTTSDISNFPTIPTKTSDLTNDNGFITGVSWNDVSNKPTLSTVATSGSYNDLSNKPTIPTVNNATLTIQKNGTTVKTFTANASSNVTADITVPTKTSDLTNDSGFLTDVTWNDVNNKPSFATVATSGSYNDLTNKPIIPDVSNYYTKAEVDALINNAGISPSTNTLFIGEPYSLVNSAESNLGNYEEVSND